MISNSERLLIKVAGGLLTAFIAGILILIAYAFRNPTLLPDFLKALFDKLLLGGIIGTTAVAVGIWLDDAKARRSFYLNQQLSAAKAVVHSASDLSKAAADWFFFYGRPGDKAFFLQQIESFGSIYGDNAVVLPISFQAALREFHRLLLEVYYPCRDGSSYAWANSPGAPDAMSSAEFILALRDWLATEFQDAIGFSSLNPAIELRLIKNKPFPVCVTEWESRVMKAA